MMARAQDFTIYTGTQFSVVHGLNYGDPMSSKADLYLDDVYRLKTKVQPTRLTLQTAATGRHHRRNWRGRTSGLPNHSYL